MDFSRLRRYAASLFPVLIALTAGSGTLHATNLLTASSTSVALTCSTVAGPGTASLTIKPATALTGSNTLAVSVGSLTGGVVVTAPSSQTLTASNSTAGIVYTVSLAAGCVGVSNGASPTFHFNTGGSTADVTITVNTTLVAAASGLTVSPSALTVSCVKSGNTYTPGPAQTLSVTSAATGGTPFTVDTTTNPAAAWLTVTPTTGGTATASAVTFTAVAASGCGGFASGTTNTTTIHLLNSPAPDKLITVSLQVVPPSVLVATPSPASISYVKGSGAAAYAQVNVTAPGVTPAPFFSVDTSSLPIWLTVDAVTGTVPKSIRFSNTTVADTLAPGTYSTSVRLNVSGYGALAVPISLFITNSSPKLSIEGGNVVSMNWTVGQALPTPTVTAISTDTPIAYTATTGGTLQPTIAAGQQNGLAYSFGTPINVSFNPLVFAAAQPGTQLTGTLSLTWGSPASTIVVTFSVNVLSPGSTVTGLSPASLPTASSGTFTVALTGTGFVTGTDPTQRTKVGIVSNGSLITDTNISSTIVNPSNMILTFTVPATADANLPFSPSGTGGNVIIGVCNPVNGTCSIPTGQATLSIGSNPIIQAVTSASSLIQVTPPTVPTIAPYDMISIFGANFCSSGGTGCSSSQVLTGSPDPVLLSYPTSLSPDAAGATQRAVSVTFQTTASTPVSLGTAPLLFATNGQINLLVPSGVAAQIGNQVNIVVNFGYGSGATLHSSAPFTVNVAATDPGIFTIGADGQGSGAALDLSYNLIGNTNPGGMRSTAADSDTIQIYMTGLGVPDSTASNGSTGGGVWPTDCVSPASFLSSFNTQTGNSLASLDGTLLLSSVLNTGRMAPCILQTVSSNPDPDLPSVTIGGVAGTVTYAGWVPSAVAGLYQLNVTLPGSGAGPFTNTAGAAVSTITAPVQLPVVVTSNSKSSQSGVSIWVAPRLKVAPPSGAGLTGTVGVTWGSSNNSVAATEGTSPYRYAVTSGLLPSGLTLNASTGAISGVPAANTAGSYTVTVTATDSANVPVTGTTTFTLTVAGGLYMTSTGTAPYHATFGTASASLTTVNATSGVYPYSYAITAPGSVPTGMTVSSSGVLGTTAATPAGTYNVTVQATDSTSGTPLTGSISFSVVEALAVTHTSVVAATHGSASNVTTVSATGNTGTVTYSLDATTLALGWVTINSGTVAVTSGAVAGSYPVTVTATDGTAPSNAAAAGTGTTTFTLVVN